MTATLQSGAPEKTRSSSESSILPKQFAGQLWKEHIGLIRTQSFHPAVPLLSEFMSKDIALRYKLKTSNLHINKQKYKTQFPCNPKTKKEKRMDTRKRTAIFTCEACFALHTEEHSVFKYKACPQTCCESSKVWLKK